MPETDSQPRATAVIWPWREERVETAGESASRRRKRSLIESIVMLSAGLIIIFCFHRNVMGSVLLCLAGFVLVSGQFIPTAYNVFKRLMGLIVKTAGIILGWALLVPFFYLCFTFARVLLLVFRKDPLKRKFPTGEKSYWVTRRSVSEPKHYERQY